MAIWKDVNRTIGKAVEGIGSMTKELGESVAKPTKTDSSRKCPKCGQLLNGITAVCPMCGYELRDVKASNSISEFTKELDKLERKRNALAESITSKLSGRSANPTDEKVASLIRNFVVPNTKEDIFEFMILASGNMDAKILAGKPSENGLSEIVVKAWESKFQQTFQKAKISFGNDVDFVKIQDVFDAKMQEIEREKPRSIFSRRK